MRRVRKSWVSFIGGAAVVLGMASTLGASKASAKPECTWNPRLLDRPAGLVDRSSKTAPQAGAISLNNGDILADLDPTGWTEDDDENISVCFDVNIRKGSPDALPASLCSPPTQPTGTPVHLDFLGIDHQFRITKIR